MILARLLSATPQTDGEHWDLSFRWHYDAWHTDLYAQDPAPYQRNPQLGIPARSPYPWRPGQGLTLNGGPGFTVKLNTANSPPSLDIYGQPPVNALPVGFAPQCPLYATVSTTGGAIPSGSYLFVISADNNGPVSPYMIQAVMPPGTTTGSIVISGVVWQSAAAAIGLYVGTSSLTMYGVVGGLGTWLGSSPDSYGNPTVFTVLAFPPDGPGLPDPIFNSFLFQAKYIWHGGVWAGFAVSVGSVGGHATITTNPAWSWGVNQWAGYFLKRYDAAAPANAVDFEVLSNTATTLTLVGIVGPPAGADLVMRAQSASITASTIGDPNFVNAMTPAGLTVNAEAGRMIRIVAGTGINTPPQTIQSNTATVFTIAGTWPVTPDATSIWIVEDAQWQHSVAGSTVQQGAATGGLWHGPTVPLVGSIPIVSYVNTAFLIEALTLDINGNWSVERYAPIREIYFPAVAIPPSQTADYTITPVAGNATVDLFNGLTQNLVLNGTAVTILAPVFTDGSIYPGMSFTLYLDQDSTGQRAMPTFTGGANGFVSNTAAQITVDGTFSTATILTFTLRGGYWSVTAQNTGVALS